MSLKLGDRAPNLTLQTISGEPIDLKTYWQDGRFTYLIFLRHLA